MYQESEFAVWWRWAIWSLIALAFFLGLIGLGGYSGVILLGWAVGCIFGASVILFRRPR